VRERGVSLAQAGRDLDVHENVLRKWVKEFGSDPGQAFPGQGQMKPEQLEIERLRREVNKLKAKRDILKKAAVDSNGEGNTLRKLSARCDEAKRFPRPGVEFQRHGV
jgi:transposase